MGSFSQGNIKVINHLHFCLWGIVLWGLPFTGLFLLLGFKSEILYYILLAVVGLMLGMGFSSLSMIYPDSDRNILSFKQMLYCVAVAPFKVISSKHKK